MEMIRSDDALAGAISADSGNSVRVMSLAAHSPEHRRDAGAHRRPAAWPRAAGDRPVAEPVPHRGPTPDASQVSGWPLALTSPHLAAELVGRTSLQGTPAGAASRGSSAFLPRTSMAASSRGRPTCCPSAMPATTSPTGRSRAWRRRRPDSATNLARERPLYAASIAYNLSVLAEGRPLGPREGLRGRLFRTTSRPPGERTGMGRLPCHLPQRRRERQGRMLEVPDVEVQPQARLRGAATSPTCSTSSTRDATSGRRRSRARSLAS